MTHYLNALQTAFIHTPWSYSDLLTGGINGVTSADCLKLKSEQINISSFLAQEIFVLHNFLLISEQPFFQRNIYWLRGAQWAVGALAIWNIGSLWTHYGTEVDQTGLDGILWQNTSKILGVANAVFILLDAVEKPHRAAIFVLSFFSVIVLNHLQAHTVQYFLAAGSLSVVYNLFQKALPHITQFQRDYQPALSAWTARIFSPPSL